MLLLGLLLAGGFINLYADSPANIDDDSSCSVGVYGHLGYDSIDFPQSTIEKSLFVEVTDIEEQEERDENLTFSNLQFGSYLTAFFYASPSGPTFRELEMNLGVFKPSSLTAPYKRHIRFQVFRI